jgi:glycosyltransferase involved in cell wall biosynthesis
MKSASMQWPAELRDGKKVVFCIPTITRPHQATLDALAREAPLLDTAGWDHSMVSMIGCPYISAARANMLRQAMDAFADVVVFIDHDISWAPGNLVRLLETKGDVVAGTYRFKRDPESYMGEVLPGKDRRPQVRDDGAIKMFCIPAGFLKITRQGVNRFMEAYPELCFGHRFAPCVDLFNHGAHGWVWYGEDYAFSRRWIEKCGDIWCMPHLDITHHAGNIAYPGNYHSYLKREPGGSDSANPVPPESKAA